MTVQCDNWFLYLESILILSTFSGAQGPCAVLGSEPCCHSHIQDQSFDLCAIFLQLLSLFHAGDNFFSYFGWRLECLLLISPWPLSPYLSARRKLGGFVSLLQCFVCLAPVPADLPHPSS